MYSHRNPDPVKECPTIPREYRKTTRIVTQALTQRDKTRTIYEKQDEFHTYSILWTGGSDNIDKGYPCLTPRNGHRVLLTHVWGRGT